MGSRLSVRRSELLIAVAVGLLCLAVYAVTLCPTIYVGDSAEFAEAMALFGVPHPPGYPLYTLLGGLFVRALRWGDFGHRANLFSAVSAAGAASLFYLWLRQLHLGRLAALAATAALAFGITYWSQGVCAEVHAFNCLLFVLALVVARATGTTPSPGRVFACGLAVGLLVTHRNLNVIFLPGILAPLVQWRRARQWRAPLLFAAGALLALAVYLYLPIAAARGSALALGRPDSWPRFWAVVSTRTYFRHLASATPATALRRLASFLFQLPRNLGVALAAVPFGAAALWRQRQGSTLFACAWIGGTCVVFSSCYNVLDVETYFLPALIALTTLAGVGLDRLARFRGAAGALAVAAVALVVLNFGAANLGRHTVGRQYGEDLLRSVPPDAILLSFGDTSTHLLWYLQQVEGRRPDVVTVSTDEIADWYVDTLARRTDVDWPRAESSDWLGELVRRNLGRRPICLTQPVSLGGTDWMTLPQGLAFCLGRTPAMSAAVADSLQFWAHTQVPGLAAAMPRDIHEQMTIFSYGLARFHLIRLLVAANLDEEARAQARQLVATDPDRVERAIEQALLSVGRQVAQPFDCGERSKKLLQTPPSERASLLRLLEL